MGEVEFLERAHRLLTGDSAPVRIGPEAAQHRRALQRATAISGSGYEGYRLAADGSSATLRDATQVDARVAGLLQDAQREHREARERSTRLVQEARADTVAPTASPMAQREALRRSAARLRAQHAVIATTRRRALRRAALLRRLRYLSRHRRGRYPLPAAGGRAATAVRAALSRLGRPYVWGATGPNQFDCSGLVQWAYRQAGMPLPRTTYDQIHIGTPVSHAQVRPGDLVFPHTGHVQMAIGNGKVIEAPYSGATVRISALGDAIAIRRPG